MERYKLEPVLLSEEDVRVLTESLQHTSRRRDIPEADRERAHVLRLSLSEKFDA